MKFYSPSIVLAAVLSLAAAGTACASPMQAPLAPSLVQGPAGKTPGAANPWPGLLSLGSQQSTELAYDDHYRRDGHWQSRQEQIRREHWRREQARREAERRHEWERRHHHRR
jgi:hypothetical protein